MNSDNRYVTEETKKCAGKGCKQIDKTILRIQYIHREGAFCEQCAADLVKLGLVEEKKKIEEVSNQ
jgi:hypothetical protein